MRSPSSRKNSPEKRASRSAQRARMTASDSVKRRTRRPTGTPKAGLRDSSLPMPKPATTRPPLSTSSVASAFASCTGLRWGSTNTAVPSRTRSVTAATHESRLTGSRLRLPPSTWSSVHRLSKPRASARRATRATRATSTGVSSDTCGRAKPTGVLTTRPRAAARPAPRTPPPSPARPPAPPESPRTPPPCAASPPPPRARPRG